MGVDGWLDVADELTDDFMPAFVKIYCPIKKNLIGEVWEDASNKIAYDTRRKYVLGIICRSNELPITPADFRYPEAMRSLQDICEEMIRYQENYQPTFV